MLFRLGPRRGWRLLIVTGLIVAASGLGANATFAASVLRVPQDFSTIQAAISAAAPGDTVSVSPGIYDETIDNQSKAITIESTGGAGVTTIDGGAVGTVVTLTANAGESPILKGFTIRNGRAQFDGGGITALGGSPLIEDNVITSNVACSGGGGMSVGAAATIIDNVISNNSECFGYSGGAGGGIAASGSVQIIGNQIVDNSFAEGSGGGISLSGGGNATISGNLISGNAAGGDGGGIWIVNDATPTVANNLIIKNSAGLIGNIVPNGRGGGVYWLGFWMGSLAVVNNTIALNKGAQGSAIYGNSFQPAQAFNNVVYGSDSGVLIYCDDFNTQSPPLLTYNDVFNAGSGTRYGGICTDQTGTNGNIPADPLFVSAASGDFHLQQGSPAIDAGTNTGAPSVDLDGNTRPIDGNGDGIATVDMGAYEFRPSDITPPAITVPGPMTVNATFPSGAVVTYSVSATDPDDAVASLNCVPDSGSTFSIGTTTVTCTATDMHGNSSNATFTVHVKGATEQLSDLAGAVTGVGPGASLADKLSQVQTYLAATDKADACSTLTAFIRQVKAQTGKTIPVSEAATLTGDALQIATVLGC